MSIERRHAITRELVSKFNFKKFGSESFPAHQSDINSLAGDSSCWFRWKFGLDKDTKAQFRSIQAVFGSALHKTIELLHRDKNWDKAKELFLEVFHTMLNAPGEPEVRDNGKPRDVYERDGQNIIEGYALKTYNREAIIIAAEIPFTVQIGKYWFEGTIDQIRKSPEGLVLIDFKSGVTVPNQRELNYGFQFGIYSAALLDGTLYSNGTIQRLCQFPDRIYHYQLRNHIPYATSGSKAVERVSDCEWYGASAGSEVKYKKCDERGPVLYEAFRSPDELTVLERHLNAIIGAVRFLKFYPTIGSLCESYCSYKNECDGILNESVSELIKIA